MESIEDIVYRMRSSLDALARSGSISVLPDYFLDRFVTIDSIDELVRSIQMKSAVGGGSIRGVTQFEVKGGNAVNLAYALGMFGARVNLLTIADSLSLETLRSFFRDMKNVSLEIIEGKSGLTIALEFPENNRRVNVMLSDTGDVQDFDGSTVSSKIWEWLSESKITAVVNWAANSKGTELCERVYQSSKRKGGLTFFDPADVSHLKEKIPQLKRAIFDRGLIDFMSLNDNELRIFCKTLGGYELPQDYSESEISNAVKLISDVSHAIVDLHSRKFSISCEKGSIVIAPCHKLTQKIVTGAGDVWDAGDILGHLLAWRVEDRLRFANSAAGLYVTRESPESPVTEDVINYIQKSKDYY